MSNFKEISIESEERNALSTFRKSLEKLFWSILKAGKS
jgi:hypothetical protein